MNYAATQADGQSFIGAFTDRLPGGWDGNAGRNLRLDIRWNAGDAELAKIYGARLIGLTPDMILASSTYNLSRVGGRHHPCVLKSELAARSARSIAAATPSFERFQDF